MAHSGRFVGNMLAHLSNVNPPIPAGDAGGTGAAPDYGIRERFTFSDHAAESYNGNPTSLANRFDTSGCMCFVDGDHCGAVLITPQHIICPTHVGVPIFVQGVSLDGSCTRVAVDHTAMYVVKRDNSIKLFESAAIDAPQIVANNTDITVARLLTPVDDTLTPVRFLNSGSVAQLGFDPGNPAVMLPQIPVFRFNQFYEIHLYGWYGYTLNGNQALTYVTTPSGGSPGVRFVDYNRAVINGDSGWPIFVADTDGTAAVVTANGYGDFWPYYAAGIQAAVDALGGGYTINTVTLMDTTRVTLQNTGIVFNSTGDSWTGVATSFHLPLASGPFGFFNSQFEFNGNYYLEGNISNITDAAAGNSITQIDFNFTYDASNASGDDTMSIDVGFSTAPGTQRVADVASGVSTTGTIVALSFTGLALSQTVFNALKWHFEIGNNGSTEGDSAYFYNGTIDVTYTSVGGAQVKRRLSLGVGQSMGVGM